MGNNLLSACKNTSAPSEQNDAESEQTQKDKQEKRKLERKRVNKNRSDLSSVHAEGILQNNPRHLEEQSDFSSQQMNAYDGQSSQNGEINSVYNQGSEVQLNSMRKSQKKMGQKRLMNNFMNSSQNQQNEKFQLQQSESMLNTTEQEQMQQNQEEEERQLQNNNDKYFSKEDLEFYEIKYKNEKKAVPPKDKNIRWQQGEVLGSGSFGQVILGMNIDTGEFMAVKQVHIGGYNQQDRKEKVQQIQSEIEALQNFSDKNIVRYIGIKKSETSINIFLEYVPGGSISSLLYRYGKFNETLIRKFTSQILKGLEYLHANEIIHRDIKGANVLVDKDGNCKLADFGSAKKIVEEKGHNDSIRGTPYWMAPETIKQAGSGRFADIWSIGCTVIEMATAKPPWADRNPIQAMFYIANAVEPPPIPDGLSPECKNFISKCLRINPSERYNVRQLLNHPFISGKKQNMNQSVKQLAQITEEATIDYQTSSPDKRKEFLSREESRGNTLFEEDNMKDSIQKLRFSVKTRTNKNVKKEESESSQDSSDDQGKQKQQLNNPRPINTQPKIIQSRQNQKQGYNNNDDYSGNMAVNNKKQNNDQISKSSRNSSSSSSSSSLEKKKVTQVNSNNTENIPTRKKQITPFSVNHKQQSQQQQKQQYTQLQQQQNQPYNQQQNSQKQTNYQNINEWSNNGNYSHTNNFTQDKLKTHSQQNSPQNQSQNSPKQDQISKNQFQNNNNSQYKMQNNNQNLNSNNFDSKFNNTAKLNSLTQNSDTKESQPPQLFNYSSNDGSSIQKQQRGLQTFGNKQIDRKVQNLVDSRDSPSSKPDSPQQKIVNSSPQNGQTQIQEQKNKSSNTERSKQNEEEQEQKLVFVDSFDDLEEEGQQVQFYAVDPIMQYQEQKNNAFEQNANKNMNRNGRIKREIAEPNSETFNKDKFGKLKFSKPKSPKQINTFNSIGGNTFNNNSFDQIGYDNKNNSHTDNTVQNKVTSSLKQDQAKEYNKYLEQNQKSRQDDYNSSSIDSYLITQYMAQNQKVQNNYQENQIGRNIESINIDNESQFESYNSKQNDKYKQNIISKDY